MKRLILTIFTILIANVSQAEVYNLDCKSETEAFIVNINSDNNTINFLDRENFDLAVDDYIFTAEISPKGALVYADVTTFDYFDGYVQFYLGKGLKNTKSGETLTIALDADDGDGFGFDKRVYDCKVTY